MGWIILTVVIFLGLMVWLGFSEGKWRFRVKQLFSLVALVFLLPGMFVMIPANSVGVQYSPFSGVSEQTLGEGFHSKNFFDKTYVLSTEVQTTQLADLTGQTQDSQWVNISVDIKYRVNSTDAFSVFRNYRSLKNVQDSLISPTIQRAINQVTTKFNVIDILGESQNEVYKQLEEVLAQRLAADGITFVSINLTDLDAGTAIETAIATEAVAKKAVETATQEKAKAEIDASRKSVEAQAKLEAAKIEAETKVVEAKAQADANLLLSSSITPELIAMKEAEARMQHGWVTVQGAGSTIVSP